MRDEVAAPMALTRRAILLMGGGSALTACTAGPCTPPAGATFGALTFGDVRVCQEESPAALHGVAVTMPPDAPSIIADYRTALDVTLEPRDIRHTGIDIGGVEGKTAVLAAMDGTVEEAGFTTWGGNAVLLWHGQDAAGRDVLTAYFHMARVLTARGRQVARGDVLGLVGRTGMSSGGAPHVHYGFYVGANFRRLPLLDYAFSAHRNPHLYWHDGPGKVTLFRPGAAYPNRAGATFPVAGRNEQLYFERMAAELAARSPA